MNYYEHHIGDYAEATSHLSFAEDAAYSRCLRKYYATEKPLPPDVAHVQRLIGARTREERAAVESVLREFFDLQDDGWHQKRADAEIARFQDKQSKAKRSANVRWSAQRPQSDGNANASPNAMRTHSERNALQTPDTRHQTPKEEGAENVATPLRARSREPEPEDQDPGSGDVGGHEPTPAGRICLAMRQAGMQAVNPGDPRLLAMVEQGATEAEFAGLAAEATAKGKGWAWCLVTLEARRREAASIALAPPVEDQAEAARKAEREAEEQRKADERRRDAELRSPEGRARADAARRAAMSSIGRVA